MIALVLLSAVFAESISDATMARALDRELNAENAAYILIGVRDGRIVASNWSDPDRAVPMGSLVKPFTALAYAERHGFRFPIFTCAGERDRCWFPQGHGQLGLEDAIAHSCNSWFQQLADRTDAADVVRVLSRFGVHTPSADVAAETLIGRGDAWKFSPLEMVRAYCELASRASDNAIKPMLRGMALSARSGTASELHAPAMAKTGTAPCSHAMRNGTDGFVVVLYPSEQPKCALLIRMHGKTGAQTARTAGRFFRTIENCGR
jgi:cell division protein FtsI/penicillin-binding protein 2